MVGKNDQSTNCTTSYTLLPCHPNIYTHYLREQGITDVIHFEGFEYNQKIKIMHLKFLQVNVYANYILLCFGTDKYTHLHIADTECVHLIVTKN